MGKSSTRHVQVLLLLGPAGTGKTTVAQHLQMNHGFIRLRMADVLKDMLKAMGLTHAQVDGCEKEIPLAILGGKTPRYAMRTIGTEWRNMISRRLWSDIIYERIKMLSVGHSDLRVVIDDCRFPHEVDTFPDMDVETWLIWNSTKIYPYFRMWLARRGWGCWLLRRIGSSVHASEAWWDHLGHTIEIDNTGSLDELYAAASATLEGQSAFEVDGHPDAVIRLQEAKS